MNITPHLLLSLLALFLISCGASTPSSSEATPKPTGPAQIDLQLSNTQSGTAYLLGTFADQNYRVDSAVVDAQGKLSFQSASGYESGLVYVYLPDRSYFQLLLDQDQEFSVSGDPKNAVETMQITGSLDNELLYQSLRFEADMQPKFMAVAQKIKSTSPLSLEHQAAQDEQKALIKERKDYLENIFKEHPRSFFSIFKKAGQNPELKEIYREDGRLDTLKQLALYKSEFWKDVDFSDERLLRTPVVSNKLKRFIVDLTPQNPDSVKAAASQLVDRVLDQPEYFKFFANWITLTYQPTKSTLMDAEAVYVHMIQRYFTRERAFWADTNQVYNLQMRAREMGSSLIGQKGMDVKAPDPGGILRSIYAIESPYVLVFLYNPICDHCIEAIPELKALYRQWKSKGVEIYAIAVDTENETWKAFIQEQDMNWINVFDPSNAAIYGKYYVDNTPELYVLNPDRIIIGKNLKVAQVAEIIEQDQQ